GTGRADVGVAVVAVDAPRVEDALQIDELVAGPTEVVHHLALAALDERLADPPRDVVEHLVPADALPLAAAPRSLAPQRREDALRVLDLVERGRALRAVAPAAARVHGVALELLDRERVLIDVGQQPAGRLAVEADRRDQRVAPRHLAGPRDRIELLPVAPALDRRIGGERGGRRELARGPRPGVAVGPG